MGGDHGPHVTVPAVVDYLQGNPAIAVVLVGLPDVIESELRAIRCTQSSRLRIHAASEVVGMDESPATALRGKKNSSMRVALDLVKSGEAQACISAGNTGALLATSRFVLKTLPGIDRPALAVVLPTMKGHTYVLDLGANVNCTAEHLLQFGVMGATLVSSIENKEKPSIGLLNIGEEEIKGNDVVKRAAELLRDSGLNFYGNIEGNDIYKGTTDVVVCDGFVGNVALKTSEGVAQMLSVSLCCSTSALCNSGTLGERSVTCASCWRIFSAAGFIREQCEGMLMGNMTVRFAPLDLAASMPRTTASL